MEAINTPFQACKLIVLKPNPVFETLKSKHNWSWIPFLIIAFCSMLPSALFFGIIDFEWYKEMLLQSQQGDVSPAERDMFMQSMDLEQLKNFTLIGSISSLVVSNAIFAVYLNLFTKSDENNTWAFSDWYAFGWWASLPVAATSLLAALLIGLFGEPQMSPAIMNPTSLAFLLNISMNSDYFLFSQSVRLENFWMMYLTVVGLSRWTQLPMKKNYIIATAPYVFIWTVLFIAS